MMKKLYLSFANPETWRNKIREEISRGEWKKLRLEILERDNYTCQYCGFKAEKWQIVHHVDGNPNNNDKINLEVICPMCNLINHSGQGCVIQGIVDLYEQSKYSQNEIITITRKKRAKGVNDKEIIEYLGLKSKTQFKMDRNYLKRLFGFITSRKTEGWTHKSLEYGYRTIESIKITMNK